MSNYFNWLTFEWLMKNLEWVGAVMFLSLAVLLFFPIILTIEFRKLSKKKDYSGITIHFISNLHVYIYFCFFI